MEIQEKLLNVVPLNAPPTRQKAECIIKELIEIGNVQWTEHASQRMKERKITMIEVINCLQKGKVIDNPYLANKRNGWETTVERIFSDHILKIGICLAFSQRIIVITAIN